MLAPVWVGVLGATMVAPEAGEPPLELRAAKHRALLAALALHQGRTVSADALVDAIWGPDAPTSAGATLQSYVSVVRRTLQPDLPARVASSYLVSVDNGYRLVADTDAEAFAATVHDIHARVGALATDLVPVADDPDQADLLAARLADALTAWRGEAFDDLPESDAVRPERARLQALRVLAQEDRATLLVAAGRDAEAVGELESLTREHPLRERPWQLLAASLARTGRQAEALAALDELRTTLDAELGLEPSREINQLQTAVLRHELPAARQRAVGSSTAVDEPGAVTIALPEWPLVGREQHLEVLEGLLERADAGVPAFASLVGEPGAGKSRLGAELAARAQQRGALVLVGHSSQDEDAPPMWPWRQVLGDDVVDRAASGADPDAARFAMAESVRRAIADLSRDRTVVLGLEDLHWADPSSLRVLRHVCAHLDAGRLLLLATWRRGATAAPTLAAQALADVAETLARRHATSLDVAGLTEEETGRLISGLAGDLDPSVTSALHRRTDGNPFFLIEYGRLARDEGRGLGEAIETVPATVAAVVSRRISQLPEPTATTLTAGAVIGREFSVDVLARALDADELALLDLLQPAVDGDLVRDVGGDHFRFGHALARDAAYGSLTPSRRERLHARIATIVEERPDAAPRAPEVARHWAAAGPRHVGRAWRASARAGALAMSAHAADEAAAHLEAALTLQGQDPEREDRDRYDLLVEYATACRWSTRRVEMHAASDEAIELAGTIGDPELVVRAAAVPTYDALWPARRYGDVNESVIRVMREALAGLSLDDSAVRCRLLVALATESYYVARTEEIDRLAEEALGIARRLGDASLLAETLLGCVVVLWRADQADRRESLLEECRVLAEQVGDERLTVNARCLQASVGSELGSAPGPTAELEEIAAAARELRMYFAELIVVCLAHSWSAMRGDADELVAQSARLAELDELMSLAHKVDTIQGAAFYVPMWDTTQLPRDELVQGFLGVTAVPVITAAVALFLRHGQPDRARMLWESHDFDPHTDNWYSPAYWAFSAEAALGLADPAVGAAVYSRLRPFSGRCVMSGSNPAIGPVDAYLAIAAAATGDLALATEHADHAVEQIQAWHIPQVESWFADLRHRHGF
jgi:DNA-binding SARP family transcriptional activator